MFKDDDDDDDDLATTATRYPIMPSLVTLQQMRNRLHLANLGKKLMKWTALVTGKELRKLALEMNTTIISYADDIRQAFMLLARARYFYPQLNDVVLENVKKVASVTVGTSTRSVSGVKVLHLQVVNSGHDPYLHMGIEKGGRAISDAKKAWFNLLKLMIFILQQRTVFMQVEYAHKSATKKQNVLTKLIIPRIKATIAYIMSELEEREREEIFRLKRFKQLKLSRLVKSQKDKEPIPTIKEEIIEKIVPVKKVIVKPIVEEKIGDEKVKEEISKEKEIVEKPVTKEIMTPEIKVKDKLAESLTYTHTCACCQSVFDVEGKSDQFICPLCQLEAKAEENIIDLKKNVVPCKNSSQRTIENRERLEHLMAHINEVIDLAGQYKSEGIMSPSIDNFIETCGTVKEKIEDYTKSPLPCDNTCLAIDHPENIADNINSSLTCDCSSITTDQQDNIENNKKPLLPCVPTSIIMNQPKNYEDGTKLQSPCECPSLALDDVEKIGDTTNIPFLNNFNNALNLKNIDSTKCSLPCDCISLTKDQPAINQSSTISPLVCDCTSLDTKEPEEFEDGAETSLPCECISAMDQTNKIVDSSKSKSPCSFVTGTMEEPDIIKNTSFLASAPYNSPCTHQPITCDSSTKPINDFILTPISDTKLGYFEKKYKEIVKVTRLKNPDGTISEEKKLITIRTERTNPRTLDENERKFIGNCTTNGSGYGGGGYSGTSGPTFSGAQYPPTKPGRLSGDGGAHGGSAECDGVCDTGGQYFGYDEMKKTERKAYVPTETKSEASKRSAVISEPKIRTCLSEGCQISGINDVSTEPDRTCVCEESPKTQSDNKKMPLAMVHKTTSVDSGLCCLNSRFVCSTELGSCPLVLNPTESVEISTSTPTCWYDVQDKKTKTKTEDKTTSCIQSCGERTYHLFPTVENKYVNNEAIQTEVPSYLECISKQNPIEPTTSAHSCDSKCSKRKSKTSNSSSCTIKIIPKPPKICSLEENDDDTEIFLRGSMLSVLRKLMLSSSKSTQCSQMELEIQHICSCCMSKINASSKKENCPDKLRLNPSCFACQAQTEIVKKEASDSCFSALGKNPRLSASCRSTAESSYSAASSDYRPTGSSLSPTTKSSFFSCPSDRPSEVCCAKTNRYYRRFVEVEPSYTRQDAITLTQKSDRFDSRPLKGFKIGHACEKIHSECGACHSDTHMLAQNSQCWSSCSKTQSCCDDDYFFKW